MPSEQAELERLQREVKALREEVTASELDGRLRDRDRELERRMASLDSAWAGVAARGDRVDGRFGQLMALVKEIVEQVHTQGYVIVPSLLDAKQVERIREAMEPLFIATRRMFATLDPRGPRQTIHIQNVLAKTRAADEVAINPLLRAIVGGVLGHDFILNAGAIFMSPDSGCDPQGLHRDDGGYALLPRPRLPLVLTAAIALDEFTKENGGTQLVPGSCCWPGTRIPNLEEVVYCEMSPGSVLLWDGAMFHGGGANSTDGHRRTLTFNYTRGWLRSQFNQYLSIPRAVILAMPPELQSDLGYALSARGLGGCDNQEPLAYLRRMVAAGGDGSQPMLGRETDPD